MKKIISFVWVGIVALYCNVAQAQQQTTRQSVEELLLVTHAQDSVNEMLQSLMTLSQNGVTRELKGVDLSPKGQKIAAKIPNQINKQLSSELSWSKVKDDYIVLYQSTFTQKEIDAQIAFYKTTEGAQILIKNSGLTKSVLSNLNKRVNPLLSSVSNTIKTEVQRAKLAK